MLPTFFKAVSGRLWESLLNVFTTRSTREFSRFTAAPIPVGVPAEQSPAFLNVEPLGNDFATGSGPADCEELFTTLIRAEKYDSAWELLTPDSQMSWPTRQIFKDEMEARQPGRGLLGSRVREVRFLPMWTDQSTRRTHRQVAELVVDYRFRDQSREMVVTRDVHLVNVSGDWKSLCYRS